MTDQDPAPVPDVPDVVDPDNVTVVKPGVRQYGASLERLIVPSIVGAITGWLVNHSITVDPALVAILVSGLYFAIIRALEHWISPKFSWLLGSPHTPVYPDANPD